MECEKNSNITSSSVSVEDNNMPSKSYPVTIQVELPAQPHVQIVAEKSKSSFLSGWLPCLIVGLIAMFTLIGIYVFGGSKLFPVFVDRYKDLLPIVKQGYIEIYPFDSGLSIGTKRIFTFELPPLDLNATVKVIESLLTGYPEHTHLQHTYRNCWFENPSYDNPCFVDVSWIEDFCPSNNSYGYELNKNSYNPCFFLRLVQTDTWKPLPFQEDELPDSLRNNYDPGFFPIDCRFKHGNTINMKIQVYPPKGFSTLYFPISQFNPELYLNPLVAIRVSGIPEGVNLTLECSILTRNSFILNDLGVFSVSFTQFNILRNT